MNILYNLNIDIYSELYDLFVTHLQLSKVVVRASFLFSCFCSVLLANRADYELFEVSFHGLGQVADLLSLKTPLQKAYPLPSTVQRVLVLHRVTEKGG